MVELNLYRWNSGLICPRFGRNKFRHLKHRHLHEYTKCDCQFSLMLGTKFEHTRLLLTQWFAVNCLVVANMSVLLAERLAKMVSVAWSTACLMLRISCRYKGGRYHWYWFDGLVGERKPGKKSLMFTMEHHENNMGFRATRLVKQLNSGLVREFLECTLVSKVRTNIMLALRVLGESLRREPKATLPEKVNEWLTRLSSSVTSIAFWQEPQLSERLLQIAGDHVLIRTSFCYCWKRVI